MRLFVSRAVLFGIVLAGSFSALAQSPTASVQAATRHLRQNAKALGLSPSDIGDLAVADQHTSSVSGVTYIYFQQVIGDVPVYDGIVNVSVDRNGNVLSVGNRAVADLHGRLRGRAQAVSAETAGQAAGRALGHRDVRVERERVVPGLTERVVLSTDDASEITAQLMYVPLLQGGVYLAWVTEATGPDGDLWQVIVDAASGEVLSTQSLTDHDQWAAADHYPAGWAVVAPDRSPVATDAPGLALAPLAQLSAFASAAPAAAGQYRVYAGAVESPGHAGNTAVDLRTLVATAGNATASPQGWHSTGAESYTVTRGNNVRAGLDLAAPNGIDAGSEPDGGAGLAFDYVFNPAAQRPAEYRQAAVTNLFYWNNVIHDVAWFYGFDEAAGNFQATNFGGAPGAGDYVNAEAQDYSGTNNANFSTPADGSQPRMQMFVWGTPFVNELSLGAPVNRTFAMSGAAWGGTFPTSGLTLPFALVSDGTALPEQGCNALVNGASVAGKIAVAYRGSCAFTVKAKNAQNAGAVALVVINNAPGNPGTLGGADPTVTIPAGMISDVNGAILVGALPIAGAVRSLGTSVLDRDSDFDNGVITHEYAHGISNRLTGGRLNSSCLGTVYTGGGLTFESEQMGEGWSDFYALLLTDTNTDNRGIGTYLNYEPTSGQGIRPYRYSTSLSTNPATYNYIKTAVAPHGVGFVWATMLWDMTRNLVGRYGYDPDVYTGRGGNNLALKLVTEGLKAQPCRPGFVDGRNAILAADLAVTGGANQCLIWDSFARRGLGASASQGAYYDKTDGTEAFDLPVSCSTSAMNEAAVRALETAGVLTRGQATSLVVKLQGAGAKLAAGQPTVALNQMGAFVNEVNALVNSGRLTAEQAQALLDLAAGYVRRIREMYPSAAVAAAPSASLTAGDLALPTEFALEQNAPNPVGPSTVIRFALPETAHVRLSVFDVMGREVATLVDAELAAGFHRLPFDGTQLASGTYVYRIQAGDFTASRRMAVVR